MLISQEPVRRIVIVAVSIAIRLTNKHFIEDFQFLIKLNYESSL